MSGMIADTITIKVGHGIMTIPRKKNYKQKDYDAPADGQESAVQPAEGK